MASFMLIHGAWHGGWCWEQLTPELEARGHNVHAPNLPGHGGDSADPASVTFEDYVRRITDRLAAAGEPVILLGHSMGGMPVSAAAEAAPKHVRTLVYLCAFLPRDGESLAAIEGRNPQPTVPPHVVEKGAVLTIPREHHKQLFYGNVAEADVLAAQERHVPQPSEPFVARVSLGERFAGIPKHYVACTEDGAISIELQRDMAGATPGVTLHEFPWDHSPFYSAPAALADTLDGIARA